MEGAKPFVPRRLASAVIAIKEPVVKLVKEVTDFEVQPAAQLHLFESCMGSGRTDPVVEHHEQDMDRMSRDQQEDQHIGHQDKAFDRMHCKAGPWAGIDVAVVP